MQSINVKINKMLIANFLMYSSSFFIAKCKIQVFRWRNELEYTEILFSCIERDRQREGRVMRRIEITFFIDRKYCLTQNTLT